MTVARPRNGLLQRSCNYNSGARARAERRQKRSEFIANSCPDSGCVFLVKQPSLKMPCFLRMMDVPPPIEANADDPKLRQSVAETTASYPPGQETSSHLGIIREILKVRQVHGS
ncbi:hypothetical protein LZ31DRAFT_553525 [Colletotrichum somersetense]|nr:hypothetical protein LZ31DRAFT_553525 [Colletotrichum somersetense]